MYQARISALYEGMNAYTRTVPANALTQAVAKELRQLRNSRGFTMVEAAERAGISVVTIQRYETGSKIKLEELAELVWALGGDPAQLFADAVDAVARVQEND